MGRYKLHSKVEWLLFIVGSGSDISLCLQRIGAYAICAHDFTVAKDDTKRAAAMIKDYVNSVKARVRKK